jgi:hypothetical protein
VLLGMANASASRSTAVTLLRSLVSVVLARRVVCRVKH